MRKLIAAINTTIDGFCDHDLGIADDELHDHYTELLQNAGTLLYGRKTFQLMEYWPTVLKNQTGNKAEYEFALAIDKVEKVVFSHTLKSLDWKTARLATPKDLEEEVLELRQQPGKDIFVGSPSLIVQLTNLNLIDEYQLCVHPVIAGEGLPLFKNMEEKRILKLFNTKSFSSGAITLYYKPAAK
jgi:dihydrofolate reductase